MLDEIQPLKAKLSFYEMTAEESCKKVEQIYIDKETALQERIQVLEQENKDHIQTQLDNRQIQESFKGNILDLQEKSQMEVIIMRVN